MKENKKRIIVWGTIFVIFVISSVIGTIGFKKGYGKIGSIQMKLNPIATEFNKLESVKKYGDLNATVDGDKLVVVDSNKNQKYVYKFSKENNINTITNTYSAADTITGELILKAMVDSVYHLNGGKGSIFDKYELKNLTAVNINDGIVYKSDGETTVTININVNLADNIKGKVVTIQQNSYIKESDLTNMMAQLKANKTFKITRFDITIFVMDSNQSFYEIYTKLDSDNDVNIYKSLAYVVKILKPEVFDEIMDEDGNPKIDYSSNKYKIISNALFTDSSIFGTTENIFEMILYK